jgi:hypothetical protein
VTRARVGYTGPRYRMGSVGRLRELSESAIRDGLYCHWSEAQIPVKLPGFSANKATTECDCGCYCGLFGACQIALMTSIARAGPHPPAATVYLFGRTPYYATTYTSTFTQYRLRTLSTRDS